MSDWSCVQLVLCSASVLVLFQSSSFRVVPDTWVCRSHIWCIWYRAEETCMSMSVCHEASASVWTCLYFFSITRITSRRRCPSHVWSRVAAMRRPVTTVNVTIRSICTLGSLLFYFNVVGEIRMAALRYACVHRWISVRFVRKSERGS